MQYLEKKSHGFKEKSHNIWGKMSQYIQQQSRIMLKKKTTILEEKKSQYLEVVISRPVTTITWLSNRTIWNCSSSSYLSLSPFPVGSTPFC